MQSEEEIIAAVKAAAEELGRVPTFEWLVRHQKVTQYAIRKHFGDGGN